MKRKHKILKLNRCLGPFPKDEMGPARFLKTLAPEGPM